MTGLNELTNNEREALAYFSLSSLEHELSQRKYRSATYDGFDRESKILYDDDEYHGRSYAINVHKGNTYTDEPIIDVEYTEYSIKHNNATTCGELRVVPSSLTVQRIQLYMRDYMLHNAYEALLYAVDNDESHIRNLLLRRNLNMHRTVTAFDAMNDILHMIQNDNVTANSAATMLSSQFYLSSEHVAIAQPASVYVHIGIHNGKACARASIRDFQAHMNDMSSPLNVSNYMLYEGVMCLNNMHYACNSQDFLAPNLRASLPFKLDVSANIRTQPDYNAYTILAPTTLAASLLFGTYALASQCKLTQIIKYGINAIRHSVTKTHEPQKYEQKTQQVKEVKEENNEVKEENEKHKQTEKDNAASKNSVV